MVFWTVLENENINMVKIYIYFNYSMGNKYHGEKMKTACYYQILTKPKKEGSNKSANITILEY